MAERLSPRNKARLLQSAEQEMRKYMTRVSDELISRHSGPWPTGTTATTLSKRSGKGVRSIKNFMVKGTADGVEGVWRLTRTMSFHERGGVIRAKNARYLTIPLPAALDSRGVPLRVSAREWDNTFIQMSRNGNLIIFQNRGREIVPLYVLKRSVRVPPRLGMRQTLIDNRPEFRRQLTARVKEFLSMQGKGR